MTRQLASGTLVEVDPDGTIVAWLVEPADDGPDRSAEQVDWEAWADRTV